MTSRPSRDAWIETKVSSSLKIPLTSRPSRDAWIETKLTIHRLP